MKVCLIRLALLLLAVFVTTACAVSPATQATEMMACDDDIRCVEVEEGELINIASMIVSSGPVAFLGDDQIGAIEIAVADYGPIHGHEVSLRHEDSLCSAEGGQTAAQKVASDPSIVGVLGTACSSAATAALPIISEAGLSMISASNTSPTLTDADRDAGGVWQAGYYRTAHNDLFQGKLAAEFAYNELEVRTVATIHDGSPYADKLQEVMALEFEKLGGTVTYQGAVNIGDTDMRPLLTAISSGSPELLFFPIFQPEGNFIAVQTGEIAGLENVRLMGADGLFTQDFPGNTGEAAVGMYLTAPLVQNEAYDQLLQKWAEMHGGNPPASFHSHMYDATVMLLDAISDSTQADESGNLLIGLQGVRDYLSSVAGFNGITGSLTCGPTGDCATGEALAVFQMTDATLSGEWPPELVFKP
jgi:branched-chain amino acid transport system substrate-binding protein